MTTEKQISFVIFLAFVVLVVIIIGLIIGKCVRSRMKEAPPPVNTIGIVIAIVIVIIGAYIVYFFETNQYDLKFFMKLVPLLILPFIRKVPNDSIVLAYTPSKYLVFQKGMYFMIPFYWKIITIRFDDCIPNWEGYTKDELTTKAYDIAIEKYNERLTNH